MYEDTPTYDFLNGDDYLDTKGDEETWIIEPLVPTAGWVNLYGLPKKARKSYLALGMAHAVATAQEHWLGFELRSAGPVVYLQVDTPRNLWRERLEHIVAGGYDFSNVYFADPYNAPHPFNMMGWHCDELKAMLDRLVDRIRMDPVMIILDTSRKLHQSNENDNGEMSILMDRIQSVTPYMARVLVSHQKKFGKQEVDENGVEIEGELMEGNRGATAVAGAVDTIIRLTKNGRMDFQGRATAGEERRQLRFVKVCPCIPPPGKLCPGQMWMLDKDTPEEAAQKLMKAYPNYALAGLARMLAREYDIHEEAARSLIRRLREKSPIVLTDKE